MGPTADPGMAPEENERYRYLLFNPALWGLILSLVCSLYLAYGLFKEPAAIENKYNEKQLEAYRSWGLKSPLEEDAEKQRKERVKAISGLAAFAFVGIFMVVQLTRRKTTLRQMFMPFHELVFDRSGLWYDRTLFLPWRLVVDFHYHDPSEDIERGGRRGKEITISYIDPEHQSMNRLVISGWTPKFAQMKNYLEDVKNAAMPKNLQCPRCQKDFEVDAQENKIIYSCRACGQQYTQEL
ncbi:MAG TPA: hypothetical protein PKH10_02190 [bacterium]|nr:hypothetical protein [bacterium]